MALEEDKDELGIESLDTALIDAGIKPEIDDEMTPDEAAAALAMATRVSGGMLKIQNPQPIQPQETTEQPKLALEEESTEETPEVEEEPEEEKIDKDALKADIQNMIKAEMSDFRKELMAQLEDGEEQED